MLNNPSLTYYLNEFKAKGKKRPLYLRITLNRKKAEIATKYIFEPKQWDETNQCTRNNGDINQDLNATKNKIYEIVKGLEKDKKSISAQIIKDFLTGKNKVIASLIDSFDRYIERLKLEGAAKNETVSMFGVTKKHLQKFLQERKISDIPIENIDYTFISDFDLYLLRQPIRKDAIDKIGRNTANKHHSRLRTIIIRAIKEGHIQKNPFIDFKLKKIPSNRTFLTEDELLLITKHLLGGNESLKKVRDIFLFSVYTGLRFEDAQNLKISDIIKENSGKHTLRIKQEKTNEPSIIPILPPAMVIIKKYQNSPERKVLKMVLPKISNQKVNAYLKVIADLTGIKKSLTHHVARHTCATTILLSNEVPIEAVSKWLGHTNIKTTQIYAKITSEYLQKVAEKLELKSYQYE